MYLILFIAIALLSFVVQTNLNSKFKKFSKVPLASGMTGREVAEKMLHDNGIYNVEVTCTPGYLTDHYNPTTATVNLSQGVYNSNSVAAAAIAAHEWTCCAACCGLWTFENAFSLSPCGIFRIQLGTMDIVGRYFND